MQDLQSLLPPVSSLLQKGIQILLCSRKIELIFYLFAMKKEISSVPVKPVAGGVNCQDACGGEEAESTESCGWARGWGCHSVPWVLSVGRPAGATAFHTTSSGPIASCLPCASHIHHISWERLWIVQRWRVPKGKRPSAGDLSFVKQRCLGWQGWFSFSMFGWASPFLQKICLKPLSKGVYYLEDT